MVSKNKTNILPQIYIFGVKKLETNLWRREFKDSNDMIFTAKSSHTCI